MKAVGIRELKARLSQYLAEVKRGETLLVTERGHVIAQIGRPVEQLHPDPFARALWPLVEKGEVRIGGLDDRDRIYRPTGLRLESEAIARDLADSRDEDRS